MAKKLISLRLNEDRLKELRELANVYTNGNTTQLIETLIRRMYFLEPLALEGKYRDPGFGVNKTEQEKFYDAWDIWINQAFSFNKPNKVNCDKRYVYTVNGEFQSFKSSELTQLAHILKLPIDTNSVYTISIKKTPGK